MGVSFGVGVDLVSPATATPLTSIKESHPSPYFDAQTLVSIALVIPLASMWHLFSLLMLCP